MIIRDHLKCTTCEAAHTVRVGLGQEPRQTHRFACRSCGEEIEIALVAEPPRAWIECEENCARAPGNANAPVVNLDANFLFPSDQQGMEHVMPRLQQQHAMLQAARAMNGGTLDLDAIDPRRIRHANYATEWPALQKAWSLHRNNQGVLARAQIKKANKTIYAADPLTDLSDWFWRFSSSLAQPAYEHVFRDALAIIQPLHGTKPMLDFRAHYAKEMSGARGSKYVKVLREYFHGYSDFAQLHFLIASGIEIDADHHAAGADFARTGMFYGNAFESLGDLVDLLAMLNNMLLGRPFNTLERLPSLKAFYELDKSARGGPFSANATFARFVAENDNQLRNASHHGGIDFDIGQRLLCCRSGKGGQGPVRTLTYTEYLAKSVRLFMQVVTLLRFELALATQLQLRPPV